MIQRRVFATALPTFAAAVAAAALLPSLALAQAPPWPTKQSIRIISPYAPGGTTDVLARLLAQPLQQKLASFGVARGIPDFRQDSHREQ